ncbi:hypothetical protein J4Q44_G00067300 [Coregonus suidteri]|uniref:Uncharacterized protein n=1 Tax=Coregonus suidteri TaxID=861788 RepID=A0AAN8M3X9_9TELE
MGQKEDIGLKKEHVQINVGLMVPSGTDLKPLRGKTLQLFTDPEVAAPDLLKQAVQKMTTFNKDMHEGPYVLLYPDCSEVVHVPGSERPFKLAEYKKEIGKAYSRITFFICLEKHYKRVDDTSDSDSEIVITTGSTAELNRADTLVFEPQNRSTPKHKLDDERDAPGQSTIQPGQIVISDAEDLDPPEANPEKMSCYRPVFTTNVEQEDEEPVAVNVKNFQHTAMEETDIALPDIVANLSLPIDHKKVSRFNISRDNVWDGAVRGFKRTTYSETCVMLIENAASLEALQECMMRHSTMLQTAGCLRHVATVEEKKEIVSDYLQWYTIDRNSSVIDRFRDGLSTLEFLTALQQHPTLLAPVMCHSERRLTAFELERLFKPDLSPSGSNRRLKESQTMAYWGRLSP